MREVFVEEGTRHILNAVKGILYSHAEFVLDVLSVDQGIGLASHLAQNDSFRETFMKHVRQVIEVKLVGQAIEQMTAFTKTLTSSIGTSCRL